MVFFLTCVKKVSKQNIINQITTEKKLYFVLNVNMKEKLKENQYAKTIRFK